jgi:CHAD domain-containing protein
VSRVDATAWLERLDRARAVALAGKDPEGVHQVRVVARRLRVWLSLGGEEALQDDLRWLCQALSTERDLDVLSEVLRGDGVEALRASARKRVCAALESPRYAALREALGAMRGPKRKQARRVAKKLAQAVARRRRALEGPLTLASADALHALRRALRRARYAREWLDEDAAELATEQEQLGVLCDLCALRKLVGRRVPAVRAELDAGLERALQVVNVARA